MNTAKTFVSLVALWSVVAFSACSLGAQNSGSEESPAKAADATPRQKTKAYLGVVVKAVSPELASQLGGLLSDEQGLVVEQMTQDSPAAKAGIRTHDILATFEDQKLYSVDQLMKLIRTDKPGRKATLGIVRGGKMASIEITLGQQKNPQRPPTRQTRTTRPPRRRVTTLPPIPTPPGATNARPNVGKPDWERFDSLHVQKTAKNQFKVTLNHVDDNGQKKQHEYQGTQQEISATVWNDNSLPDSEVAHLPLGIYTPEESMWALPSLSQNYTGYFVDSGNGAITIQELGGETSTFQLAPDATITRNGQPARLEDLRSTDIATVTEEGTVATKVTAKSVDPYSGSASRITIPAYLDGLASVESVDGFHTILEGKNGGVGPCHTDGRMSIGALAVE